MVDQIVFAVFFLVDFSRYHTVLLFDDRQALIAGCRQTDKIRIELFSVFADYFRRIALRVDADKYYFHVFSLIAQLFQRVAVSQQLGWAYVRTVGITERQDDHFAFQIAQAERFAVAIGQCKITTNVFFAHIGTTRLHFGRRLTGSSRRSRSGRCRRSLFGLLFRLTSSQSSQRKSTE